MTIPLWSVLFLILMPFVLALVSDYLRFKEFGVFDNEHPREQVAKLTGAGARTWAAQQNSWEALMMFAPAVLIAHVVGADPIQSTNAAVVFCIARVTHSICYIFNLSTIRSLSYFVALGCCLWLFLLSSMV